MADLTPIAPDGAQTGTGETGAGETPAGPVRLGRDQGGARRRQARPNRTAPPDAQAISGTAEINGGALPERLPEPEEEPPLLTFAELLLFAYRDFIAEPDAILAAFGFGRAHHRVLHFVNRQPGLRVNDLLDILKITKQSLARVLKQLVDEGYIAQRSGEHDRRERRLYATEKGRALAAELSEPLLRRLEQALGDLAPEQAEIVRQFLCDMIAPEERARVARVIATAPPSPPARPARRNAGGAERARGAAGASSSRRRAERE